MTEWGPEALAQITEIQTDFGPIPVRTKRVTVYTCESCGMSAPDMEFQRLDTTEQREEMANRWARRHGAIGMELVVD